MPLSGSQLVTHVGALLDLKNPRKWHTLANALCCHYQQEISLHKALTAVFQVFCNTCEALITLFNGLLQEKFWSEMQCLCKPDWKQNRKPLSKKDLKYSFCFVVYDSPVPQVNLFMQRAADICSVVDFTLHTDVGICSCSLDRAWEFALTFLVKESLETRKPLARSMKQLENTLNNQVEHQCSPWYTSECSQSFVY